MSANLAHIAGPSTWDVSASTRGPISPMNPSSPTSSVLISIRSRARVHRCPRGGGRAARAPRRVWGPWAIRRRPAIARVRPARVPLGLLPRPIRAVAVPRELEQRRPGILTALWWKRIAAGGCSSTSTGRAAQNGVRRGVRARSPGSSGIDAPPLGRDRRCPPRRADDRVAPGADRSRW